MCASLIFSQSKTKASLPAAKIEGGHTLPPPKESASRDKTLVAFLTRFKAALKRKDREALLAALAPDVSPGLHGTPGPAGFTTYWELNVPNSYIYALLTQILSLNGVWVGEHILRALCRCPISRGHGPLQSPRHLESRRAPARNPRRRQAACSPRFPTTSSKSSIALRIGPRSARSPDSSASSPLLTSIAPLRIARVSPRTPRASGNSSPCPPADEDSCHSVPRLRPRRGPSAQAAPPMTRT